MNSSRKLIFGVALILLVAAGAAFLEMNHRSSKTTAPNTQVAPAAESAEPAPAQPGGAPPPAPSSGRLTG